MAKHGDIATGPGWELRCGAWQDVLADVECDALITDPPYGERTHKGQRHGRRGGVLRSDGRMDSWASCRGIGYESIGSEDVKALLRAWSPRVGGWIAAHTSHDLLPAFDDGADKCGRVRFAPVACVLRGMNVRLAGDGPSNWTVYLHVSRPKGMKRGTLPGAYVGTPGSGPSRGRLPVVGAKPLWLMQAIVRDYSRPGDLVCDPYAGGGTTLLAAVIEGRRAIGAELDPVTFEKAVARLRKGYTPSMFARREQARVQLVPGELPF